jgi:hypothetical protein
MPLELLTVSWDGKRLLAVEYKTTALQANESIAKDAINIFQRSLACENSVMDACGAREASYILDGPGGNSR